MDAWRPVEELRKIRNCDEAGGLGVLEARYAFGLSVEGDGLLVASEGSTKSPGLLERIGQDGGEEVIALVPAEELSKQAVFGCSVAAIPPASGSPVRCVVGAGRRVTVGGTDGGVWLIHHDGTRRFVEAPLDDGNVGCAVEVLSIGDDGEVFVAVGADNVDDGHGAVLTLRLDPAGKATWSSGENPTVVGFPLGTVEGARVGCALARVAHESPGVRIAIAAAGTGVGDAGRVGLFDWTERDGFRLSRVIEPSELRGAGIPVTRFGRALAANGNELLISSAVDFAHAGADGMPDILTPGFTKDPALLWSVDLSTHDTSPRGVWLGNGATQSVLNGFGRALAPGDGPGRYHVGSDGIGCGIVWEVQLGEDQR